MTETWLPFALRLPGPTEKQGYPGAARRALDQIEGEVKHNMEGSLGGAFAELGKLTRRASWTFSISKIGEVYQHYPLEAITWHCGRIGDFDSLSAAIGNLVLVGIEHEGAAGEPLTEAQIQATLRISQQLHFLCPKVASAGPVRRVTLWEHRELSQTSCPSDRIPWERIIAGLKEDDMALTPEQETWLGKAAALADMLMTPYTDAAGRPWPNAFTFLMAHTNAFDLQRFKWLLGEENFPLDMPALEALRLELGAIATADAKAIVDEIKKRL